MRRRRRRNPSLSDVTTLAQIAMLGGLAYLFYKYVWPLFNKGAGAVAGPIAKAYVAVTSGPAITATNQVMLPNGTAIPMQQIGATGTLKDTTQPDGTPSATFTWQGVNYTIIGGADDTGTYYAQAS
jgi:hypothetical protein